MPGTAGRSGRLPTPTALKLMTGNPGKRPLNKEPEPPPASLDPPAFLTEAGRTFWEKYAPWLSANGLLTELDVPLFAEACDQDALHRRLQDRVNATPFAKNAPEWQRRADKALLNRDRCLARFGFSPSDRAKLSIKPAGEEDEFEKLLGRKKA